MEKETAMIRTALGIVLLLLLGPLASNADATFICAGGRRYCALEPHWRRMLR
jgi:hypothetical protein